MKSFFSDKHNINKMITLIEGKKIILDDVEVAVIFYGVDKLILVGLLIMPIWIQYLMQLLEIIRA